MPSEFQLLGMFVFEKKDWSNKIFTLSSCWLRASLHLLFLYQDHKVELLPHWRHVSYASNYLFAFPETGRKTKPNMCCLTVRLVWWRIRSADGALCAWFSWFAGKHGVWARSMSSDSGLITWDTSAAGVPSSRLLVFAVFENLPNDQLPARSLQMQPASTTRCFPFYFSAANCSGTVAGLSVLVSRQQPRLQKCLPCVFSQGNINHSSGLVLLLRENWRVE